VLLLRHEDDHAAAGATRAGGTPQAMDVLLAGAGHADLRDRQNRWNRARGRCGFGGAELRAKSNHHLSALLTKQLQTIDIGRLLTLSCEML
jgi:hypothetical protein